jgi:hypothetical protein
MYMSPSPLVNLVCKDRFYVLHRHQKTAPLLCQPIGTLLPSEAISGKFSKYKEINGHFCALQTNQK